MWEGRVFSNGMSQLISGCRWYYITAFNACVQTQDNAEGALAKNSSRKFISFSPHKIILINPSTELGSHILRILQNVIMLKNGGVRGIWNVLGRREMHTEFW